MADYKKEFDVKSGLAVNSSVIIDSTGTIASSNISVTDTGGHYAATNVEQVLEEIGTKIITNNSNKFELYDSNEALRIKLGLTTTTEDDPFIKFISSTDGSMVHGLIKKFQNGIWIGNSIPENENGIFQAKTGYNGMFFSFQENTIYIVHDTIQSNIYNESSTARFG